MKKKYSGERLETFIFGYDTVDHLHRYSIVLEFAKNKRVVDIACGAGYGSAIISKIATEVIGIDIDSYTISEAKKTYRSSNLSFLVGNTDNIPIESKSVDLVVSFETIEHHDRHKEMYFEIKRILKPDGILIISSPDKKYYSDIRNKVNPFHIKELYLEEFRDLNSKNFKNINMYLQKSINGNSTIAEESVFNNLKVYSGSYNDIYNQTITPLYNIVIASDVEFNKIGYSVFNGEEISSIINKRNMEEILFSRTYKTGRFILFPFIEIKNFLKKRMS